MPFVTAITAQKIHLRENRFILKIWQAFAEPNSCATDSSVLKGLRLRGCGCGEGAGFSERAGWMPVVRQELRQVAILECEHA
jgi:hypothetical protein